MIDGEGKEVSVLALALLAVGDARAQAPELQMEDTEVVMAARNLGGVGMLA